ncbi:MAG: hypothetical protein ABW095_01580 [Candidatus Thiodiazotropha sp.]
MNRSGDEVFSRLLQVVKNLYAETSGLAPEDAELQLWYNRGYADGMVAAMNRQGYAQNVQEALNPAPQPVSEESPFLPWGKAYRHGFEMGEGETLEVLPSRG